MVYTYLGTGYGRIELFRTMQEVDALRTPPLHVHVIALGTHQYLQSILVLVERK